MTADNDKFALRVVCGSYLLANEIARRGSDTERTRRMRKVIAIKRQAIADTFPRFRPRSVGSGDWGRSRVG